MNLQLPKHNKSKCSVLTFKTRKRNFHNDLVTETKSMHDTDS